MPGGVGRPILAPLSKHTGRASTGPRRPVSSLSSTMVGPLGGSNGMYGQTIQIMRYSSRRGRVQLASTSLSVKSRTLEWGSGRSQFVTSLCGWFLSTQQSPPSWLTRKSETVGHGAPLKRPDSFRQGQSSFVERAFVVGSCACRYLPALAPFVSYFVPSKGARGLRRLLHAIGSLVTYLDTLGSMPQIGQFWSLSGCYSPDSRTARSNSSRPGSVCSSPSACHRLNWLRAARNMARYADSSSNPCS